MKLRCRICGSIIEEKELDSCPVCYGSSSFLEPYETVKEKETIFLNAVKISKENLGVEKDDSKCIDCGMCKETCKKVTGLDFKEKTEYCLSCGQCILTCPTKALKPKKTIEEVKKSLKDGKILICYTSPAVRVSVGEGFGKEPGTFLAKQLVGALFKLGFSYVFDTTFGADLTIVEEAFEFKNRLEHDGVFPMMTSCCPSWVKYVKTSFPELLDHLSTCKSPIGMQGEMVKEFFLEKENLKEEDVFTVAITPCTAKKMEIKENHLKTDAVLTISEVIEWMKEENINIDQVEERDFSSLLQEGSGGGTLFGVTGGVMDSFLRTFYYIETGKNLENFDFSVLHTMDPVKEFTLEIENKSFHFLVVHELSKAKKILEEIKWNKSPYHFIEIMNCKGGCIGGGGEPRYVLENEEKVKEQRKSGLIERDENVSIRTSYQNPDIKRVYHEFLKLPNGPIAHKYLHTEKKETVK